MEAAEEIFRGGCLCGAVRYEAQGPATKLCFCHCETCRRAAGAPGVPWATFQVANFKLTKGALAEYRSSPQVVRGFCAQCGSSLTYRNSARATEIDVTPVTLDDPERLAPKAHIWMQDRLSWEVPGDGLPRFATNRTDGNS
jgi:hypothetical protein